MLEREEESEDTKARITQLQNNIKQHDKEHPMKSFHTKDTSNTQANKRKRPNKEVDGQGADPKGLGITGCAELRALGYEVKPQAGEETDEKGGVLKPLSKAKVRLPLPTYASR